jgi:hypothetical protein
MRRGRDGTGRGWRKDGKGREGNFFSSGHRVIQRGKRGQPFCSVASSIACYAGFYFSANPLYKILLSSPCYWEGRGRNWTGNLPLYTLWSRRTSLVPRWGSSSAKESDTSTAPLMVDFFFYCRQKCAEDKTWKSGEGVEGHITAVK